MFYTKTLRKTIVIKFSQHNGTLPLPWRKQVNYPVIPIYGAVAEVGARMSLKMKTDHHQYLSGDDHRYCFGYPPPLFIVNLEFTSLHRI